MSTKDSIKELQGKCVNYDAQIKILTEQNTKLVNVINILTTKFAKYDKELKEYKDIINKLIYNSNATNDNVNTLTKSMEDINVTNEGVTKNIEDIINEINSINFKLENEQNSFINLSNMNSPKPFDTIKNLINDINVIIDKTKE